MKKQEKANRKYHLVNWYCWNTYKCGVIDAAYLLYDTIDIEWNQAIIRLLRETRAHLQA